MMIAFTNSKGGVGKSTLAVHTAVWLHDQGLRVALLDADKQRSSSQWILEAEAQITNRVADTPEQCVALAHDLMNDHDLVIADGPAGMDDLSRTLLLLSQLALIPVGPSILDFRSVTEATRIVRYAQQINTHGLEGALILNRIGVRDRITRELLANLPDLGLGAATSTIRNLTAFRDAAQRGTVVTRMGREAQAASDDVHQLFVELFGGLIAHQVRGAVHG